MMREIVAISIEKEGSGIPREHKVTRSVLPAREHEVSLRS